MTGFPTADQVAAAIVAACRATGEDPFELCGGAYGIRARHLAMDALMEAFPEARRAGLGACLGYPTPRAAPAAVITARKAAWWRDTLADEVLGAVVAPLYRERAL